MTEKRYRLGVIGFAHMHINALIGSFDQQPHVEWVACADTVPKVPSVSQEPGTRQANVQRALEQTGIPQYYQDYREMLDKESFDIMLVCSENAQHGEVVEATADKGIHVVVEKPMATHLSDALRMVRAARRNQVKLIVNWPSTWFAPVRKAHELVEAGEIGEVFRFKYRNAASMGPLSYGQQMSEAEKGKEWWHQADTGGGAFLDYCCYGANLSRWFLGEAPTAAYGLQANLNNHFGSADDNGVVVARYPKAIAVIEGSWTFLHPGIPNGPIIYGSDGTLVCDRSSVKIYKDKKSMEPTVVHDDLMLPAGRETLALEVFHHLETGEPLHPTLDLPVNLDAMALLDAGLRSAASGKQELVNDKYWNIG